MKQKIVLIVGILFMGFTTLSFAQDFENPVQYMDYINKQQTNISKKFLSYNSAVSHGKRARKVEKLRLKLLDEVQEAKMNISSLIKYKGNGSYRDSTVNFLKFYFNLLNDDYAKIVNMEDIVEQSYDEMEAYINLQEQISAKLEDANKRIKEAEKQFAASNNVNLIETKSDIGNMLEKVGKVNKYFHQIFLIYYKPKYQESMLMKAIENKNISGIEQNRSALSKYAKEGLQKLTEISAFDGDNSVKTACQQLLNFYVKEADEKTQVITDFILTKEKFDKIKKDYENKSSPTKADVEAYNQGVNELNKGVAKYNENNNNLNTQRSELYKNWNKTEDSFFDDHTPVYK